MYSCHQHEKNKHCDQKCDHEDLHDFFIAEPRGYARLTRCSFIVPKKEYYSTLFLLSLHFSPLTECEKAQELVPAPCFRNLRKQKEPHMVPSKVPYGADFLQDH